MDHDPSALKKRKEELQKKLADPEILHNPREVKKLSVEFSKLEKRIRAYNRLTELDRLIAEHRAMEKENDTELAAVAREERAAFERERTELAKKLEDADELASDLIMEIRAGAGGDEAALFAHDLSSMYRRFAEQRNWNVAVLHESKNDLGGYKEIVFEINGEDAYKMLRWESGVHRVQRIPETEKSGRVHTSTASVAVLPQAENVDVDIRPQDVKVEFFRSSGPGGQNVNKVETAVRIYHIPSGVIVTSQESRSQQKNREQALKLLRAKLLDARLQEEAKKIATERRQQIGTGDRSEKIRTYNFPQDRITDHRIKTSWHHIESVLTGNLEPIVDALQKELQRKA